jgi:hypothetical protein
MFRTALIVISALLGVALAAEVTALPHLWSLSSRGHTVVGEVVSAEVGPKAHAVIRIVLNSRTLEFTEPCGGFPCRAGERLPVTILPEDPSVHVSGDLGDQFRTAFVATFFVGPLLFGGGVAYSLWRSVRSPRVGIMNRTLLRYLPVFMSAGAILSTGIALLLGGRLARFQLIATISFGLGSVFYVLAVRRRPPVMMPQGALAAIFYVIGAVLAISDFF